MCSTFLDLCGQGPTQGDDAVGNKGLKSALESSMVGFGAFRASFTWNATPSGDHMAHARAEIRDSEPGIAKDRCVIVRYWRRYSNSVGIKPKPRRDSAFRFLDEHTRSTPLYCPAGRLYAIQKKMPRSHSVV